MDGVSNVSAALGIVSVGIQVCQGLLDYYNSWKGFKTDIASAHDCIKDLYQTLTLLQQSLVRANVDQASVARVQTCLESCVEGLEKLQKKLQKIQTHAEPSGSRQKVLAEFQRLSYPFKESTLAKLREEVGDLRERLSVALQVLQLDVSTETHDTLKSVATDVQQLVTEQQAARFQEAIDWLSPPDPWTNHASARKLHEPHTGDWLLQSGQYQKWRRGDVRHMWFYGKAGCGKTVLSSTVIEDLKLYCKTTTGSRLAVFYFTFSDNRKQSFESLLLSLVAQLGREEPCRSRLQQEYKKSNRSPPAPATLEELLLLCIAQSAQVFLVLDALDECPEIGEARWSMLYCLQWLSEKASNLKIFATSRELGDIRECMNSLGVVAIQTSTLPVDADIERYVANELSRDRRLNRLDERTKALIMDTFAQRSNGMFRWAYCQLLELKKLKFTKPSHVRTALLALPPTLDETYERILTGIDSVCRDDALVLLRWLVYAERPLSLRELVEATIIDPSGDGTVDTADRGDDSEGVLDILVGLVVAEKTQIYDWSGIDSETGEHGSLVSAEPKSSQRINGSSIVRLAHFSVQEYLESDRIGASSAKHFHLDKTKEHHFLAQSCLTYLLHWSGSGEKTSTKQDLVAFPLLHYAAISWYYHSAFQQSSDVGREVLLLSSAALKNDWLLLHEPDRYLRGVFGDRAYDFWPIGSGIYYSSLLGLEVVLRALLEDGFDVDAGGGRYGNALQAASRQGHGEIVRLLIEKGANVNTQGGEFNNPLQAASYTGHEEIVRLLIEKGASVNTQGGFLGNALEAASRQGHEKIVNLLIGKGANINAQGGEYGNALLVASKNGHEKIVSLLIESGADMNAQDGYEGNALQVASYRGFAKMVELLLREGANVNAQGGRYDSALGAASWAGHVAVVDILIKWGADVTVREGSEWALEWASLRGHNEIVKRLLDAGADVNAPGIFGTALHAAAMEGYEKVVSTLLERGADINIQGGRYDSALEAAIQEGHEKVADMLVERGADVDARGGEARGGECGSSLTLAAERGWEKMVIVLLEQGADVNGPRGKYGSALQAAAAWGHEKVAEMLIEWGADVNARGGRYGSALTLAAEQGWEKMVIVLLGQGADVNDPGARFGSALQAAAAWGHEKLAEMLIERGADVNALGGRYGSALKLATEGGYENLAKTLIHHGAVLHPLEEVIGDLAALWYCEEP